MFGRGNITSLALLEDTYQTVSLLRSQWLSTPYEDLLAQIWKGRFI